jgi:hypothetical protein
MESDGKLLAEEKTRLELEKLKAEVENLHRGASPWTTIGRNPPLIIAIITTGIGIFQFTRQQQANRNQLAAQAAREDAGRAEELKKTYWVEQKRVYDLGSNSAGLIAKATSLKEVAQETRQFWGLYWGGMSLIESPEVERAMMDFGGALSAWDHTGKKPSSVESLSYQLAHCMKQSLSKTWRPVSGGDVRDKACPYP